MFLASPYKMTKEHVTRMKNVDLHLEKRVKQLHSRGSNCAEIDQFSFVQAFKEKLHKYAMENITCIFPDIKNYLPWNTDQKPSCKTSDERFNGFWNFSRLYFEMLRKPQAFGLTKPCTNVYYKTRLDKRKPQKDQSINYSFFQCSIFQSPQQETNIPRSVSLLRLADGAEAVRAPRLRPPRIPLGLRGQRRSLPGLSCISVIYVFVDYLAEFIQKKIAK